VFRHAVKPGPASKSYGLAVAKLAGIPREVLAEARRYLGALEARAAAGGASSGPQGNLFFGSPTEPVPLAEIADPVDHSGSALDPERLVKAAAIIEAVGSINPDALSPREALEKIYRLKALLED